MPALIRILAPLALAAVTAACTPAQQDDLARNAARAAITPVVAERFPGLDVQSTVDCVIENANAAQISALAADSVLGPTASTVQIVTDIVSKPETLTCLGTKGLPGVLR